MPTPGRPTIVPTRAADCRGIVSPGQARATALHLGRTRPTHLERRSPGAVSSRGGHCDPRWVTWELSTTTPGMTALAAKGGDASRPVSLWLRPLPRGTRGGQDPLFRSSPRSRGLVPRGRFRFLIVTAVCGDAVSPPETSRFSLPENSLLPRESPPVLHCKGCGFGVMEARVSHGMGTAGQMPARREDERGTDASGSSRGGGLSPATLCRGPFHAGLQAYSSEEHHLHVHPPPKAKAPLSPWVTPMPVAQTGSCSVSVCL